MKHKGLIFAAGMLIGRICWAEPGPSDGSPGPATRGDAAPAPSTPAPSDSAMRADKRLEEMLGKMQASVEEIAQLYGNPVFLQVFTNDLDRATELKQRLRAARSDEDIRRELADLEKKRDDLLNDIALKEKEATRLASRLVRQRAALDSLAAAFEQARKSVEETVK